MAGAPVGVRYWSGEDEVRDCGEEEAEGGGEGGHDGFC